MRSYSRVGATLLLLCACRGPGVDVAAERQALAERFFRGVYGCDPAVVDEIAGDDVILSYPIFESVFGTPVIRGREAVKEFSARFCQRWADAQVTVHDGVSDGDRVVLMWSFRARNAGSVPDGPPPTNREHTWGGISVFRFDKSGKLVAEIGEESDPGPAGRLAADGAQGR